jgi:hypothetical protein
LPLLPRPGRVVVGLLIGLGGVWLAWDIWRGASECGRTNEERPGGAGALRASRA